MKQIDLDKATEGCINDSIRIKPIEYIVNIHEAACLLVVGSNFSIEYEQAIKFYESK